MGKKIILYAIIITTIFISSGCRRGQERKIPEEDNIELQKIEEIEGFRSLTGYRVEGGRFDFTGIKENKWYFYSMDLETKEIIQGHEGAEEYDLYIPIDMESAVYIDLDNNLIYNNSAGERRIAGDVTGRHRPNLLISPNREAVLYTTGPMNSADLQLYLFREDEVILVKEDISEDAFNTFNFTTQWSNQKNYFIFNNREIYDNTGKRYAIIDAISAKWSPDDEHIAFIRKPENLRENEIIIGDWQTYIGYELSLLNLKNIESTVIYETQQGLIDEIDAIQWSKDGEVVGLLSGEIIKGSAKYLRNVDYQTVYLYDIKRKEGVQLQEIPYNYYEILFNNYIYGSSLGRRDAIEIIDIWGESRKKYENPVLLNSKDTFMIEYRDEGYFMDKDTLMKIVSQGEIEEVLTFPWKVQQLYFDGETRHLIVINEDNYIYIKKIN